MKIYMDRVWCTCWQASCEATFGWKLLHRDFSLGGCIVDVVDDGREDITVFIHDKDTDKVLNITDENWEEAFDSWQLLWEKQQVAETHALAI